MSKLAFVVVRTKSCLLESCTKLCLEQRPVGFVLVEMVGVGVMNISVIG